MKILIGTTNPSKIKRFEELLEGLGAEFCTLADLGIDVSPEESGGTPVENALIKARFYGNFFERVICNDSGLYFDGIPLSDPRQPGLNIRAPQGRRLDDGEMIGYYSALISSLGGRVDAYYLDGVAVYNRGKLYSFVEDTETSKACGFCMVDRPSEKRREGWPLDSVSVNRANGMYFTEGGNDRYELKDNRQARGDSRRRVIAFLKDALEL